MRMWVNRPEELDWELWFTPQKHSQNTRANGGYTYLPITFLPTYVSKQYLPTYLLIHMYQFSIHMYEFANLFTNKPTCITTYHKEKVSLNSIPLK